MDNFAINMADPQHPISGVPFASIRSINFRI
jgi:hypothetical protein